MSNDGVRVGPLGRDHFCIDVPVIVNAAEVHIRVFRGGAITVEMPEINVSSQVSLDVAQVHVRAAKIAQYVREMIKMFGWANVKNAIIAMRLEHDVFEEVLREAAAMLARKGS